ncbi:MAG: ATP-binding cassette domain-containing protein, partial [Oscillospiraceae bacterium]|nr:ATP-binding cassette domain-containing protein [Oscillospiraceae bacterium]
MIRTNDLVKTFDGFTALDKATLHVKKGSVYGLVGPNGAGKSTIIRSITGVYKQDSGEILIDGQKVYDNNA